MPALLLISAVLSFENHARLFHFYRVPSPLRYLATEPSLRRAKRIASNLFILNWSSALSLRGGWKWGINHFVHSSKKANHCLSRVHVLMHRHKRLRHQSVQHALTCVRLRCAQVVALPQSRVLRSLFKEGVKKVFVKFHGSSFWSWILRMWVRMGIYGSLIVIPQFRNPRCVRC